MKSGAGKASSEGGLDLPCQIAPSFFGSFSSKGQSVMSEGPTFDHSTWLEPAIPTLQVYHNTSSIHKSGFLGWNTVVHDQQFCTLAVSKSYTCHDISSDSSIVLPELGSAKLSHVSWAKNSQAEPFSWLVQPWQLNAASSQLLTVLAWLSCCFSLNLGSEWNQLEIGFSTMIQQLQCSSSHLGMAKELISQPSGT